MLSHRISYPVMFFLDGMMVQLALYQPEIPQNVGSLMRLCACLEVPLNIIEPLGFVWTDRHLTRSAMDYKNHCTYERYLDWEHFRAHQRGRLIGITPYGSSPLWDFMFTPNDILLMGRESNGLPASILCDLTYRVVIPMAPLCRSLNMAMAASLVLGEAIRQTRSVI